MAITFKAVVFSHHKKNNGTYPVKIRVYHNYKSRWLPTNLVCKTTDLTRSLKIKNPDVIKKANKLIESMMSITDGYSVQYLQEKDVDWVVSRIKEGMIGETFSLDFFEWAELYIQRKTESTRKAYERALNALERFIGKRELDINDITKLMLLDFMEFVDDEPKMHYSHATGKWEKTEKQKVARASSSLHLMKLQHIFNAAKDRYNDEDDDVIRIPRSPFSTIKKIFPSGGKGQKALSRELMQDIILAQTDDASVRVALDAFIVSFGLMGANLADLYTAIPFNGDVWVYNRQKTTERREDKAEMRVVIPEQIKPHLARLQEDAGGWWLPTLHRIGKDKHICNAKINDALRKWQKQTGNDDFTFYAARHTFATLLRRMGYDLALVNDCLCHKDSLDDGRRYAASSWEQRNEANRMLLESFRW